MKKTTYIAASVALLFGMSTAVLAQERDYTSAHNFIGVQGGAQCTPTPPKPYGEIVTPQFALQFGRYFNEKIGLRLHVMGYENAGQVDLTKPYYYGGVDVSQFNSANVETYKFKSLTGNLDLLIPISHNPKLHGTLALVAGFGVDYTWDFDEYNALTAGHNTDNFHYTAPCSDKETNFTGRLGFIAEFNLGKSLSAGIEFQANYKNDSYNLQFEHTSDWQFVALAGLTYNFGYKSKKSEPAQTAAPVTSQAEYEAQQAAAAQAAAAAAAAAKAKALEAQRKAEQEAAARTAAAQKKKDEPLKETVFFKIRESDPANDPALRKAAEWAKEHPNQKVVITGYADKGTGTARVNKRYAQQRAKRVADAIKALGVPADQLVVDSKGDTVQPYADNDQNRCTIIVGE